MNELLVLEHKETGFPFSCEIIMENNLIENQKLIGMKKYDGNISFANVANDDFTTNLDKSLDRADKLDYTIAAASGLLKSIFNSYFVGEFSFQDASRWGEEKVNNFVMFVAKKQGYKGDTLEGAIRSLEKGFQFSRDKVANEFGGGLQHHLRDFGHHPTIVGLVFSLLSQFTGNGYGIDTNGTFISAVLSKSAYIGENLGGDYFWCH